MVGQQYKLEKWRPRRDFTVEMWFYKKWRPTWDAVMYLNGWVKV